MREEQETIAKGKRGSLTAVRGAPVWLCAIGVRRVGPIRTLEECHRDAVQDRNSCCDVGVRKEMERMDWGKRESRGAGLAGTARLRANDLRRISPIKTSEERGRIVVREKVAVEFTGSMRKAFSGEA